MPAHYHFLRHEASIGEAQFAGSQPLDPVDMSTGRAASQMRFEDGFGIVIDSHE